MGLGVQPSESPRLTPVLLSPIHSPVLTTRTNKTLEQSLDERYPVLDALSIASTDHNLELRGCTPEEKAKMQEQERLARARRRLVEAMRLAKEELMEAVSKGGGGSARGVAGGFPPPLPLFSPTGVSDEMFADPKSVAHMPFVTEPAPYLDYVPAEPEPLGADCDRDQLVHRLSAIAVKRKQIKNSYLGIRLRDGYPRVVYDRTHASPFSTRDSTAWYSPRSREDLTLVFESRFESGNLRKAVQVDTGEYDLLITPDVSTTRHAQWFYFSVSNVRVKRKYRLNILRLPKKGSLFNEGMLPCLYSTKDAAENGVGWVRSGFDVCYFKATAKHHTLSFSLDFKHPGDTVYIAYCYPYTYTDLQKYIQNLIEDTTKKSIVRHRLLCRTLAGNACHMLTVTDFRAAAPNEPPPPAAICC